MVSTDKNDNHVPYYIAAGVADLQPMLVTFVYCEQIHPFPRRKMVHVLPQMQMLLLRPRAPRLPCLVRVPDDMIKSQFFDSGTCHDLTLTKEDGRNVTMLMTIIWEYSAVRCFVQHRFEHPCIFLGGHVARVLQRAWRRFRERRRLALCMGWRDGNSTLGRVLRTLCMEDLRRMVP